MIEKIVIAGLAYLKRQSTQERMQCTNEQYTSINQSINEATDAGTEVPLYLTSVS